MSLMQPLNPFDYWQRFRCFADFEIWLKTRAYYCVNNETFAGFGHSKQ